MVFGFIFIDEIFIISVFSVRKALKLIDYLMSYPVLFGLLNHILFRRRKDELSDYVKKLGMLSNWNLIFPHLYFCVCIKQFVIIENSHFQTFLQT